MIARGTGRIARNPRPILGRAYVRERGGKSMAKKLMEAWLGLTEGSGGTYIRPTHPGYEYGRWGRTRIPLVGDHVRFERLGTGSTVEECREGLEAHDKAAERRSRELNKRRRR